MNRHITTEQLSAYLDSELGFVETRQLEAHCRACPECGARLASMRRVVAGLGGAGRAVPPPALRQQIRRQVMQQAPVRGVRRVFESIRFLLFPLGPGLRTAAAMGMALVAGLFVVSHDFAGDGFPRRAPRAGQEVVTVKAGTQPLSLLTTTSEVAGREFIWTEAGWVQRGLEGQTPEMSLDARSPRGRELLTRYSDLQFLLVEGSPVVLSYNLQTVEIRVTPPNRVLGFEPEPRPDSRHRNLSLEA